MIVFIGFDWCLLLPTTVYAEWFWKNLLKDSNEVFAVICIP